MSPAPSRMKLLPGLFLATLLLLASGPAGVRAQSPTKGPDPVEPTIQSGGEVAATAAVEVWLGQVDDGRYPDSWQSAASLFKKVVPQERWIEILKGNRQPCGKVLSRHLKSRQFTRTLPGAPEGQYVVLQYDTSFEHRATATETVSTMLDVDGQWRTAGYFVH